MIGLTAHHRFYYYSAPADGSVYIFINRRRDRMKLLVWEAGGFMLYYKRLESGTFELPACEGNSTTIQLNWSTLVLLISGISLQSVRHRKRYLRA